MRILSCLRALASVSGLACPARRRMVAMGGRTEERALARSDMVTCNVVPACPIGMQTSSTRP